MVPSCHDMKRLVFIVNYPWESELELKDKIKDLFNYTVESLYDKYKG